MPPAVKAVRCGTEFRGGHYKCFLMKDFSTLGVDSSGRFPTSNNEHLRCSDKARSALPKRSEDLEVV